MGGSNGNKANISPARAGVGLSLAKMLMIPKLKKTQNHDNPKYEDKPTNEDNPKI